MCITLIRYLRLFWTRKGLDKWLEQDPPDARINSSPELHVLTVDQAVPPPDELVDLVGVAGAGLDVLAHDGGHANDVVMLKVTL